MAHVRLTPHTRGACRGVTLIELLLALGMAALLAAVVLLVYAAVGDTWRAQTLQGTSRVQTASALARLCRDVSAALAPAGMTEAPFVTEPPRDDRPAARAQWLMAEPTPGGDPRRYAIRRVHYEWRPGSVAPPTGRLVRRVETWRASGGAASAGEEETVATDVRRFALWVRGDAGWTDRWGAATSEGLPRAARVSLWVGATDAPPVEAETWLPAGHSVAPP